MKLAALIKKEFYRFFHDPRLILTVLLPGFVFYAIYSIFGTFINQEESVKYKLLASSESLVLEAIQAAVGETGSELDLTYELSEEKAKADVQDGKVDLYLKLPENFDLSLAGVADAQEVEIWYDLTREESLNLYQITTSVLQAAGMKFRIVSHSFSDEKDFGKMLMADLLPFLIVTFIFSACMSVTLESIAGEKERGTLATILATSVPRFHVALGKIIPLSAIAALGAVSSFIGVIFSMPKLMGTSLSMFGGYDVWSYLLLFLMILSIVPLIVSAIAAVSTFSKSVKEASAYTSVVMIFVMVLSLTSAYLPMGSWVIGIPILNVVFLIGKILSGALAVFQCLLAVGVNLLATAVLVLLVSRMLSSERIMFGK